MPDASYHRLCALVAAAAILMSCSQDQRLAQPSGNLPRGNQVTPFRPGPPAPLQRVANRLDETDTAIAEGQILYHQFNCSGCHASGGGAIGPALTDDEWIYGNSAGNIFWTIIEGRPQGMPAFGGKIADDLAWKITAYVRSLSMLTDIPPADAAQVPEPEPVTAQEATLRRGREVFLQGPCVLCHTIRGTPALADVGPDLTHVASRSMIAGILPNTRGNLAGWILNPENLKSETTMPPSLLEPNDLHALLDYLETLK